ncbi:Bacterial SH3 domain protein [Terricaulis silvestris]|uniref:Bacterial SH3 domain protein n=2 Tax=Terricaulis silvestris TaxID=2686094 RepID=A0A6I6MVH9_9CAUL|nr:Bacterial SH3 domain protein [Terricaulis silvestris]
MPKYGWELSYVMSNADDRLKVFILHARADAGFAGQVEAFLHEAGYSASNGVQSADVVVFVLSDASGRSAECIREAQEASRLGKSIAPVLPQPLREPAPGGIAQRGLIRFYIDPAAPNSGFFDGQKRLIDTLEACAEDVVMARQRVHAGRSDLDALNKELRKARDEIEQIKRSARDQQRRQAPRPAPPDLPPIYYDRPPRRGPRIPWLRGGFLLLVGAWVVGFFVSDTVSDGTRAIAANAATWATDLYGASDPPKQRTVLAEDFTPERDAFAAAAGANVRDYPLTTGNLLVELPARSPLAINGRVMIQGEWWFRVTLPDQRVGFVHQSTVAWGSPPAPPATQAPNITAVDPAVAAAAGRAGAKIRTSPSRSARVIVRVASGAALTITGKRRIGEHWWYRVRTAEGQEGFARDDVLTAPGGGTLSL